MDDQVCFLPMHSNHENLQQSLWGYWGALTSWHWYQAAPNVHLGPCYGLHPLWLFLSATEQIAGLPGSQVPDPPSHHHPPHPHPILPPLIHDTCDITETFQKPPKLVIFTSCQLRSYNANYKTSLHMYFWYKSSMITIKQQRTTLS